MADPEDPSAAAPLSPAAPSESVTMGVATIQPVPVPAPVPVPDFPGDSGTGAAANGATTEASPLVFVQPSSAPVSTGATPPNPGSGLLTILRPAAPFPPGLTAIGPVPSERKVRDWALVLQSMSIRHMIRHSFAGWVLLVNDADYAAGSSAIDRYEAENRDWPPRPTRERVRHASSPVIPAVFALMVAFFFVTGPEHLNSFWFARGVAETCTQHLLCSGPSQVAAASQPWRAVTALTLHADTTHVLGNAIAGTIFASAVQRRLGAGGAMLAVVASGALGNVGNAIYHRSWLGVDHGWLGASTAVFGVIGVLAATELILHRPDPKHTRNWVELVAPIAGGLALLGELGSGNGDGRTDLGAHFFGFLAGVLIGLAIAIPLRRTTLAFDLASGQHGHEVSLGRGAPRWWVQATLGGLAAAIVVVAWEMALRR